MDPGELLEQPDNTTATGVKWQHHFYNFTFDPLILSYRAHYHSCQHYTITTVCTLPITFLRWAISSDPNYRNH